MRVSILGDICPTDDTEGIFMSGSVESYSPELLSHLRNSDYVIANLEYSVTDNPKEFIKTGPILNYPSKTLSFIKTLGVTHLSLANNHIKDCGPDAVLETLKHTRETGFVTFGAGSSAEQAKNAVFIKHNGFNLCLVSFAEHEFNAAYSEEPGAALFDPLDDLDYIQDLSNNSDLLIVIYHGGIEYHKYPSPLLQKRCRRMIDKGADYIFCQHSHVVGSQEVYKEGIIIYGQGNSIYGYRKNNRDWNTGILIDLEIDTSKLEPISIIYSVIQAYPNSLKLCNHIESETILSDYYKRSQKVDDPIHIKNEWHKFCLSKKSLYYPQLFGLTKFHNRLNRLTGNRLVDFIYSKKSKMVTKNLIRCESHNEVVLTILDDLEK